MDGSNERERERERERDITTCMEREVRLVDEEWAKAKERSEGGTRQIVMVEGGVRE